MASACDAPEQAHSAAPRFFQELERLTRDRAASRRAHALLILFRHEAWDGRVEAAKRLQERWSLAAVHGSRPLQKGWVETPEQARVALDHLAAFAEGLRDKQQAQVLHLATDAPVTLLIEFARHFRPTVFAQVVVCLLYTSPSPRD